MAKRSIEIIISAENRTAGALAGAKAELAGYAADVKRINANIAAATRAGDIGAAAGQMGLLGGAQERQATMRQQVEGRAALAARLTAYKEEHAAIRASVGATDELAGSHRKVSAEIAQGNSAMEKSVDSAFRLGRGLMIAHIATKGIELAASMLEGDYEAAAEALKQLPYVGPGFLAGRHLGHALAGAVSEKLYGDDAAGKAVSEGLGEASGAKMSLASITEESKRRLRIAGMGEEQKALFLLNEERTNAISKIDALGMVEERLLAGKPEHAAALAATNAEFDAKEERIRRKANDDHAADVVAATNEREERERKETELIAKAAEARSRAHKAAAAAAAKNAEPRAEREADNERYRRESFEGLQDEASTAAEKAAEPRAASGIARRGGYSSVSAFDRGFLTRAPGSTFDESRAKHEENTAKATAATAKATEKTAKAVETLSLRQELLFRELLTALRPGKVINF